MIDVCWECPPVFVAPDSQSRARLCPIHLSMRVCNCNLGENRDQGHLGTCPREYAQMRRDGMAEQRNTDLEAEAIAAVKGKRVHYKGSFYAKGSARAWAIKNGLILTATNRIRSMREIETRQAADKFLFAYKQLLLRHRRVDVDIPDALFADARRVQNEVRRIKRERRIK